MTDSPTDELSFLQRAVNATADLISHIDPDRWQAATPCEEMDVTALVAHLVSGLEGFAEVPTTSDWATAAPPEEQRLEVDEAAAAYERAGGLMSAAWSAPGVIERSYPMPWGETPGSALVEFMIIEQVVHGWDLERATGRSARFDDELVDHTLELARRYDDPTIRVPGMFGPAVDIASDAPAFDRLAAFLGRHP